MFKSIFYKLGANPKRSAQFFFIGLILFWLFAAVIWFGMQYWPMAFYFGLIGLIPAFALAVFGYIGIFTNRYAQVINAADKHKSVNAKLK